MNGILQDIGKRLQVQAAPTDLQYARAVEKFAREWARKSGDKTQYINHLGGWVLEKLVTVTTGEVEELSGLAAHLRSQVHSLFPNMFAVQTTTMGGHAFIVSLKHKATGNKFFVEISQEEASASLAGSSFKKSVSLLVPVLLDQQM